MSEDLRKGVDLLSHRRDATGIARAGDEPQRRPERCRPVPDDFVELWPTVGWELAPEVWKCNPRSISRWLKQCGPELRRARREAVEAARIAELTKLRTREAQRKLQARERRKRYVMGRTLTPPSRRE
jgi:hypothetical protein